MGRKKKDVGSGGRWMAKKEALRKNLEGGRQKRGGFQNIDISCAERDDPHVEAKGE